MQVYQLRTGDLLSQLNRVGGWSLTRFGSYSHGRGGNTDPESYFSFGLIQLKVTTSSGKSLVVLILGVKAPPGH